MINISNDSTLVFIALESEGLETMKEVSMIINAGWVVPIIPENTVYEKYSVIVDGKTILDCIPTSVPIQFGHYWDRKLLPSILLPTS